MLDGHLKSKNTQAGHKPRGKDKAMGAKPTPAQKRASAKYDKSHTTGIYLKLNTETDKDIIEHLNSQKNRQGYIKGLIKADMNK